MLVQTEVRTMDLEEALDAVGGYTHRNPPTDREMTRLRRLAAEADDPRVRTVLRSSLRDLETLREIDAALAAAGD
ncbi:hypothetical protein [Halorarius litoreus]|uniref:hypothetical protein n=1 Tax=Halorarius litoreus TaxID=2962676 RepID=UPI0020CF3902|nr:hypothetical protein [Halorarius litoreus]